MQGHYAVVTPRRFAYALQYFAIGKKRLNTQRTVRPQVPVWWFVREKKHFLCMHKTIFLMSCGYTLSMHFGHCLSKRSKFEKWKHGKCYIDVRKRKNKKSCFCFIFSQTLDTRWPYSVGVTSPCVFQTGKGYKRSWNILEYRYSSWLVTTYWFRWPKSQCIVREKKNRKVSKFSGFVG